MTKRGQVITFYSFKGGVGRSMAVANVAVLLARLGKRVLVLDCDFEAPGLHRYFLEGEHSPPRDAPAGGQDGMLNYFGALRERLCGRWPQGFAEEAPPAASELEAIAGEVFDAGSYIHEVRPRSPGGKGKPAKPISFVAAARFDTSYPEDTRAFDWQSFYDLHGEVFPALATALARRYDYVLIDSRTGMTDIGSICTMLLPDKLVLAFSPNEQSLQGALEAGWQAVHARRQQLGRGPLPLFPLLSRVEDNEEGLKQRWVERARRGFEGMMAKALGAAKCSLETYFQMVRIPHRSFYAYGEMIAAEREHAHETGSMAQAYQTFVDVLACASAADAESVLLRRQRGELEQAPEELLFQPQTRSIEHADPVQVATAMVRSAVALLNLGQWEQGIDACQELVVEFGDSTEADLRLLVAVAMISRGAALGEVKRNEEALATYEEVMRRFGDAEEARIRHLVAMAMVNRGVAFGKAQQYEEALVANEEVVRKFGDAEEGGVREQVAIAMVNSGNSLKDVKRYEEALVAYESVVRKFGDAEGADVRRWVAGAMFNRGVALGEAKRYEEALVAYEEVVRKFSDAEDADVRRLVARAMFNRGGTLGEAKRYEEALVAYEEIVRRHGDAEDAEVRQWVAKAMVNRGLALGEAKRLEEALDAYEEVVRKFGDAEDAEVRRLVAGAMCNRGVALGKAKRLDEAIVACEEIVRKFGDAEDAEVRRLVAGAMCNRGVALGEAKLFDEAIVACEDVVRKFGDAEDAQIRHHVARAMVNRGVALGEAKRGEEALVACEDVVRKFGDAEGAEFRSQVSRALNNWGFFLLCEGKRKLSEADAEGGRALLMLAEQRVAEALKRQGDHAHALGNAGYIAFLLGREFEARDLLAAAVRLGGEEIRAAGLADADIHPLPQDAAFRALMASL